MYNIYGKCNCNNLYYYWTNQESYDYRCYRQPSHSNDYGLAPYVFDIEKATKNNKNFRTTLWTGEHLQLTLMSIAVGEEIGLEIHPDNDQFIRIEDGCGIIKVGDRRNNLYFQRKVEDDFAILIPAGTWHNLINTGPKPLKLYSIYAPPEHAPGTIDKIKNNYKY